MKIDAFQVDAFTNKVFCGNPAVVCPLDNWLCTELMQNIAMENCVAETVFFVPNHIGYEIRWFTPEIEMDLCGHATLAAAHVIWSYIDKRSSALIFNSKSGDLHVRKSSQGITLNFPARVPSPVAMPLNLIDVFDKSPLEVLKSRDYIFVYENEEEILRLTPNHNVFDLVNLDPGGLIITAKGNQVDFVSRFFTPQASILEDPVTGSAHCSLIPYWSNKIRKKSMTALQLSSRRGELFCTDQGDRVEISGEAITYMHGSIEI